MLRISDEQLKKLRSSVLLAIIALRLLPFFSTLMAKGLVESEEDHIIHMPACKWKVKSSHASFSKKYTH